MTEHCPDCGREKARRFNAYADPDGPVCLPQETTGSCMRATIAKLRLELAEAQSNAARWTGESVMMGAKAVELCDIIDALRLELAAAKAASELSTAEREVVEKAVFWAKWKHIRGGERELSAAVGELLALRAQEAEG